MKTFIVFISLIIELAVGIGLGIEIGKDQTTTEMRGYYQARINSLESRLERYENKEVFEHAEKVARITGTDLYQMLTGNKRGN